MRKSQYFPF